MFNIEQLENTDFSKTTIISMLIYGDSDRIMTWNGECRITKTRNRAWKCYTVDFKKPNDNVSQAINRHKEGTYNYYFGKCSLTRLPTYLENEYGLDGSEYPWVADPVATYHQKDVAEKLARCKINGRMPLLSNGIALGNGSVLSKIIPAIIAGCVIYFIGILVGIWIAIPTL